MGRDNLVSRSAKVLAFTDIASLPHSDSCTAQVQLKLDLNEWMTAQNNAMMKQDIVELYLKDYKRQMDIYRQEIEKRGHQYVLRSK